ncbi:MULTISPECIES: glycosyltransferase family 2 protein [unclassified Ensifer]|uniref:glycosyltransferase family 2 protein n=2 Tax=Ensifer TaxID=106591 RepID=UPI000812CF5E|nr:MULTISPECIES: glycosyltransferase family 2 protein [unclassified Ensifer]OCP03388.1 glycosyl transferase family A [Ensifer sp. LC14]OCP03720.1 glycosyl transferase family A [Ensifer sp. LC11]OCP03869.1 glycosyl transferase family A [Ensifer sp. LC13]OCP30283.1 glycosyl transferase family A [Ensifer sp. LC499]
MTMTYARTQIDIAVCTFRRQELAETLHSLALLAVPDDADIRIIVADNDATPSAEALVDQMRPTTPFEILYLHCPASNISIARNACLDASRNHYLAFVDDDETVSRTWLAQLIETARATGADVVLGPVRAEYTLSAPNWMRRGDFHSTRPVWVNGEIRTGYTCNALLDLTRPVLSGRRFNLASGRSGGEDTEFFRHMHADGGHLAYAPDALVFEPVPEKRARLTWLAKRRFRSGQTHGRLLSVRGQPRKRMAEIARATAKSGYCAIASLLLAGSPIARSRYALRAVMHAGVVSGLLGVRELQQYGAATA